MLVWVGSIFILWLSVKKTTILNKMNNKNKLTTAHSFTIACYNALVTITKAKEPECYQRKKNDELKLIKD